MEKEITCSEIAEENMEQLTAFRRRLIFMFQGVIKKYLNFSELSELVTSIVKPNVLPGYLTRLLC